MIHINSVHIHTNLIIKLNRKKDSPLTPGTTIGETIKRSYLVLIGYVGNTLGDFIPLKKALGVMYKLQYVHVLESFP